MTAQWMIVFKSVSWGHFHAQKKLFFCWTDLKKRWMRTFHPSLPSKYIIQITLMENIQQIADAVQKGLWLIIRASVQQFCQQCRTRLTRLRNELVYSDSFHAVLAWSCRKAKCQCCTATVTFVVYWPNEQICAFENHLTLESKTTNQINISSCKKYHATPPLSTISYCSVSMRASVTMKHCPSKCQCFIILLTVVVYIEVVVFNNKRWTLSNVIA